MIEEDKLEDFVKQQEGINTTQTQQPKKIEVPAGVQMPWLKKEEEISQGNQIGWQPIPIKDLPSLGLFYPDDTAIYIRSATGAEIRHWSSLNENDLSALDDMLNYVIERCVSIKSSKRMLSWKDIKEIDRFYLILAIREYTFIRGENKLTVNVSEHKKIDVRKEMIDFIQFHEKLMNYYSEEERCFVLKFKHGSIMKIEIPSVGVTSWLKHYVQRKQENQQNFDQDFLSFAPFVLRDWRGLNNDSYEKIILDSMKWDISEISVLVEIRKIFQDTINPVIKYTDEGGAELTTPLNFQGGIKSIFLIQSAFDQLV